MPEWVWNQRWWLERGEVAGEIGTGDDSWSITFQWDDGTLWGFRLNSIRDPSRTFDRHWDHQAGHLLSDNENRLSPSSYEAFAALMAELAGRDWSRPLPSLQQAILDAIGRWLDTDEWMSGKRLRSGFAGQEDAVRRAVERLTPRYVGLLPGGGGDNWRLTMTGLIESCVHERARRVIEVALEVLSERYRADPDVRSYSLDDVVVKGAFEDRERPFITGVVAAAGLLNGGGGGGSGADLRFRFDVPTDVEDLKGCRSVHDFLAYLRSRETGRPWPTAPIRCPRLSAPSERGASPVQNGHKKYDIALSFAGEDRAHAEALAERLKRQNIRVFYDRDVQAELWGKDLYEYFHDIYRDRATYCVMLVSEHYAQKLWTTHERKAAQERAFREPGGEYILPVRLDDTTVPGLRETIGYLHIDEGIERIATLLIEKVRSARPSPGV